MNPQLKNPDLIFRRVDDGRRYPPDAPPRAAADAGRDRAARADNRRTASATAGAPGQAALTRQDEAPPRRRRLRSAAPGSEP